MKVTSADVSKGLSGFWLACVFDTSQDRFIVHHFGSWRDAYDYAYRNTPIPAKVK